MSAGSLRRRIIFQGWEDVKGRPPFDRIAGTSAVALLPVDEWALEELDYTTGVLVDEVGSEQTPTLLRCFRLRAGDDTPHKLDANRNPTPVQLLRDEAITDWTHVVIWPDGFVAHESTRDAPGLSRLAGYLREMVDEHVRFFPLYDRSLLEELEALDDIKAVDVKFAVSRAEQVEGLRHDGMFAALLRVGRDVDAITISTKVSVGPSRKHFLRSDVHSEILELAGSADDFLDHLTVNGVKDDRAVRIDLLRKRLDDLLTVARSRTLGNAPDPELMYSSIEQSRRRLERSERLRRAVRVK